MTLYLNHGTCKPYAIISCEPEAICAQHGFRVLIAGLLLNRNSGTPAAFHATWYNLNLILHPNGFVVISTGKRSRFPMTGAPMGVPLYEDNAETTGKRPPPRRWFQRTLSPMTQSTTVVLFLDAPVSLTNRLRCNWAPTAFLTRAELANPTP